MEGLTLDGLKRLITYLYITVIYYVEKNAYW